MSQNIEQIGEINNDDKVFVISLWSGGYSLSNFAVEALEVYNALEKVGAYIQKQEYTGLFRYADQCFDTEYEQEQQNLTPEEIQAKEDDINTYVLDYECDLYVDCTPEGGECIYLTHGGNLKIQELTGEEYYKELSKM